MFIASELEAAMQECSGVDVNFSESNQHPAVVRIIESAKKAGVGSISYITGASIAEDNESYVNFCM